MFNNLQGAPDPHPNPPQSRSPGAERMARHRKRRRSGLRSVTIDIWEREVDQLIRCRLLASASRGDPIALRKALDGLLDQVLR